MEVKFVFPENPFHNILELVDRLSKVGFLESLIADFVQRSSTFSKF